MRHTELSLHDLQTKFKRHSVSAAMQCSGNRRHGMNEVKKIQGLDWDIGKHAISSVISPYRRFCWWSSGGWKAHCHQFCFHMHTLIELVCWKLEGDRQVQCQMDTQSYFVRKKLWFSLLSAASRSDYLMYRSQSHANRGSTQSCFDVKYVLMTNVKGVKLHQSVQLHEGSYALQRGCYGFKTMQWLLAFLVIAAICKGARSSHRHSSMQSSGIFIPKSDVQ